MSGICKPYVVVAPGVYWVDGGDDISCKLAGEAEEILLGDASYPEFEGDGVGGSSCLISVFESKCGLMFVGFW